MELQEFLKAKDGFIADSDYYEYLKVEKVGLVSYKSSDLESVMCCDEENGEEFEFNNLLDVTIEEFIIDKFSSDGCVVVKLHPVTRGSVGIDYALQEIYCYEATDYNTPDTVIVYNNSVFYEG